MGFFDDLIDWLDTAFHIANSVEAWRFWLCAIAGGLCAWAAWALLPSGTGTPLAFVAGLSGVLIGGVWHWTSWRDR